MIRRLETAPEHRLHPSSFVFALARVLRGFFGPAVLIALAAGGLERWAWILPFYLPAAGLALLGALFQYLSYRYQLRDEELWIGQGILGRQERHIPYARIQNIDLVQGPLHRLLGVADLRIETASGEAAEASMRVLSLAQIEAIRARLSKARQISAEAPSAMQDSEARSDSRGDAGQLILQVPDWQLAVLGLGSSRGLALSLAGLGLAWELAWQLDLLKRLDPEAAIERARQLGTLRQPASPSLFLALLGLFVVVTGLMTLLSAGWSLWRLKGFRLSRHGEELRLRYGLATRYTATIPRRRIQSLATSDTPLLRRLGLTRVSVETAGGDAAGSAATGRQWLAPVIPVAQLAELLAAAGIEAPAAVDDGRWRGTHPGAEGRMRRRRLLLGMLAWLPLSLLLLRLLPGLGGPISLVLGAALLLQAWLGARIEARHLGYLAAEDALLLRRGWWTRSLSLAPYSKLQALTVAESPFDRRHGMARLQADSAGRGAASHRLEMPYLGREEALELQRALAAQAARSVFRW